MGCEKEIELNFIVAHSHEARPVIDYYRLSKSNQHTAFSVFENNHIRLIVSGQGRLNASAATGYMGGISSRCSASSLWVNVGVAGHPHHRVGSLWRVNRITDQQSGRSYYPLAMPPAKQVPGANTQAANTVHSKEQQLKGTALMTVDTATSTYPADCLYDMEASGFFQTALRFSTLEKICCFKMVSDNLEHPCNSVDKKDVVRMLAPGVALIDRYLQHLSDIINIEKSFQDIDIKHLKMTFSQKEMVRELVESLTVHGICCRQDLHESVTASQLIQSLKNKLKSTQLLV